MPLGSTPGVWRSATLNRPSGLVRPDIPGLERGGAIEEQEHRRRLARDLVELAGLFVSFLPSSSKATADTPVSSSTFIPVTGLGQSYRAFADGSIELLGVLNTEEIIAGEFSVRITVDGTSVWSASVESQASWLLTGTHEGLAKFLLPIGAPALFTAQRDTIHALDVEIAAPSGSYTVAAGPESWLKATLSPAIG